MIGEPRRLRVIVAHEMSYPDPLVVAANEEVTVGERDARWPYVWCTNRNGKGGWVPETHVRRDGSSDRGRILRRFDTAELTVAAGETVLVTSAEGGWLWCTNRHGQSGWVPEENLESL